MLIHSENCSFKELELSLLEIIWYLTGIPFKSKY